MEKEKALLDAELDLATETERKPKTHYEKAFEFMGYKELPKDYEDGVLDFAKWLDGIKEKCEFCDKLATQQISILEADGVDENGQPNAYRVNRWTCKSHIYDYENREGIFNPYKYL